MDPHHVRPLSKRRRMSPARCGQGSSPAPCAHPQLHSISGGRETLFYPGWEAKAGCQVYFSLNKCSLGSAACGKTKGAVRGFSSKCLATLFFWGKKAAKPTTTTKRKAGEEKQRVNGAGDPTCQTPAERRALSVCLAGEPGDHMRPRPAPSLRSPPSRCAPRNFGETRPKRRHFPQAGSSSPLRLLGG